MWLGQSDLSLTSILIPVSTALDLLSISYERAKGKSIRWVDRSASCFIKRRSVWEPSDYLNPGGGRLYSCGCGCHLLLHQISQLPLLQLQTPRTQLLLTQNTRGCEQEKEPVFELVSMLCLPCNTYTEISSI